MQCLCKLNKYQQTHKLFLCHTGTGTGVLFHSEMGKHEKGRTEEEERLFLKVTTTRGHLIKRKFEAYM